VIFLLVILFLLVMPIAKRYIDKGDHENMRHTKELIQLMNHRDSLVINQQELAIEQQGLVIKELENINRNLENGSGN
jgi:hypothetical protein